MGDNNLKGNINFNLSAGNEKIKYYECNDNNCIFEIVDEDIDNKNDDYIIDPPESKVLNTSEKRANNKKIEGQIVVTSVLDYGKHELLQGAKINLYRINGLSPVLIESRITDESGRAIFSNIKEGCYRIIEILDKRFFEKPRYINWNEITIDKNNLKERVVIVNKLKKKMKGK